MRVIQIPTYLCPSCFCDLQYEYDSVRKKFIWRHYKTLPNRPAECPHEGLVIEKNPGELSVEV